MTGSRVRVGVSLADLAELERRVLDQAALIARLMDRVAILERGPVQMPAARRNDRLTDRAGAVLMTDILARASIEFGLPVSMLRRKIRTHPVAHARQWAMVEAHQAGLSRSMIARLLRLDGATVLHGLRAEYARRGGVDEGVAA